MSPDPTDLDTRAANAAGNLREVAARRPVPTFEPGRLPAPAPAAEPGRSPARMLAVAAVVVLVAGVVGGAAVLRRDDGGAPDRLTAEQVDPPRPHVAGWLPDGWESLGTWSIEPGEEETSLLADFQVLGTDGTPVVAIGMGPGIESFTDDEDASTSTRQERVEVDGREVWRVTTPFAGDSTWSVVAAGDRSIVVIAPTLDDEERDRLAAGAAWDGSTLTLPEAAEDWEHLLTLDDAMAAMPIALYRQQVFGAVAYQASYALPPAVTDEAMTGVSITTAGVVSDTTAVTRLFAPASRMIEVRGHDAAVGTFEEAGTTFRFVTWQERPGEKITVTGSDVTEEELLRIAEDVRPADRTTWDGLELDTRLGRFNQHLDPGVRVVELGTGETADGVAWRLVNKVPDGTAEPLSTGLELFVAMDGGRSLGMEGFSADSSSPFTESIVTGVDDDRLLLAAGLVVDEVAAVRIERPDGGVIAESDLLEAEGHRAWVAEVPPEGIVVVALDGAGAELDRMPVNGTDGCGAPNDGSAVGEDCLGIGSGVATTVPAVAEPGSVPTPDQPGD